VIPRRLLALLYRRALAAVEPERLVRDFLEIRRPAPRRGGRLAIFAAGKAAAGMASGARRLAAEDCLVVLPRGSPARGCPGRVLPASHPLPDASSQGAALEALAFFERYGEGDLVLALISGGASSLLCLPREGVTLSEKRRRILEAQRSGWPIGRVNALRTSLSAVKGGRLAEATRARVVTLVLSDVPGQDFRIVGSGPTVSRRKKTDRACLLGGNETGLDAAEAAARKMGFDVRRRRRPFGGEAQEAGRRFGRALGRLSPGGGGEAVLLLAGGETTVRLPGKAGRGGRCQEFALAAAREMAGRSGLYLLAAGSDGRDGATDSAGAFVGGSTEERARSRGLDPGRYLARHASGELFETLGDAFVTGPTGTNVADWVFGLRVRSTA
jgi:glycerate 2-kinase